MKKLVLWTLVTSICICHHLSAQSLINFNGEYTTELQTDFRKCNWVNLLCLQMEVSFGNEFRLTAASISVGKTREERLVNDCLTFSNIEEGNLPFAIAVCGIEWCKRGSRLFAGIRNVNEDYFTSPLTSLFINSSCGIFPTISCDNPVANYPFASVGIHYELDMRKWLLQGSLYNGVGYNQISGRENVFRFSPASDGIFGFVFMNYLNNGNNYHLGTALRSRMCLHNENESGGTMSQEAAKTSKKTYYTNVSILGYVEHKVIPPVSVLLQYSLNVNKNAACRQYAGVGVVYGIRQSDVGLFGGYASFQQGKYEFVTELTWKISCFKNGYVQPTLQMVKNYELCGIIGIMRLGYNLQ